MRRLLFLCILLAMTGSATARFTMTLSTTSEMLSNDAVRLNFTLTNSGDEVAYNVYLEPLLPAGVESKRLYINYLLPNQPFNGSFDISIRPDVPEGRHVIALILLYSDVNNYPFSVVFPESLVHGKNTISAARMTLPTIEVTGLTPVEFDMNVSNLDVRRRNMTLMIYLPRELSADFTIKQVEVEGNSTVVVGNRVWSESALYDSDYFIVGSVSYVDGKTIYSSRASGRVEVVKPAQLQTGVSFFMQTKTYFIALIVLAVIAVAYSAFKKKRIEHGIKEETTKESRVRKGGKKKRQ
jgi:hypothetical protein